MKKKIKVLKSELFLQQEKEVPKEVRASLKKALAKIAKNPTSSQNTMCIGGKPSAEELKQWMGRVKPETTDLVIEYFNDKGLLNKKGVKLGSDFWNKFIKE